LERLIWVKDQQYLDFFICTLLDSLH
jgi:hypothetical protein